VGWARKGTKVQLSYHCTAFGIWGWKGKRTKKGKKNVPCQLKKKNPLLSLGGRAYVHGTHCSEKEQRTSGGFLDKKEELMDQGGWKTSGEMEGRGMCRANVARGGRQLHLPLHSGVRLMSGEGRCVLSEKE